MKRVVLDIHERQEEEDYQGKYIVPVTNQGNTVDMDSTFTDSSLEITVYKAMTLDSSVIYLCF